MQDDDLDWITKGIVSKLLTSEQLSTSVLADKIGSDVDTKQINYRLDKMNSHGYVTLGRVDQDDWHKGGMAPRTAALTPTGKDWAESIDVDGWDDPDTMARRVKRLEERVDTLETENQALKLMTGFGTDQLTPDVLEMRKAIFALVDHAEEQDVNLMNHTPNFVLDEVRDVQDEVPNE